MSPTQEPTKSQCQRRIWQQRKSPFTHPRAFRPVWAAGARRHRGLLTRTASCSCSRQLVARASSAEVAMVAWFASPATMLADTRGDHLHARATGDGTHGHE